MINKRLKTILFVLSLILAAELVFLGVMHRREQNELLQQTPIPTSPTTQATENTESTEEATGESTEATAEATEEVTTEATEPEQNRFVLTFLGDCTLGSTPGDAGSVHSFIQTIGEDYDYPFRNVADILRADDFTIANLEVVLGSKGHASTKLFNFRGPAAYTKILTGSSVEAVTLANNHTMDFGQAGYDETKAILEDAGLPYVEKNGTRLVKTESGLTVGLYAAAFSFNKNDMAAAISKLRQNGAEIVICAFHWGEEGKFRPNGDQQIYGKAAIDAGADIVYGHHPHVLQKIEEYNGGVIYYSLGNFSFGGNTFPKDRDTAILQQEIIREEDGTVRLGERTIIPCSVSSDPKQNNFQPMLYEEGSKEYDRVLSKLDGSYKGPDLHVQYDDPNATEPDGDETEPDDEPTDGTDEPTEGGTDTPTEGGTDTPTEGGTDTPPEGGTDAPTEGGSGETGGETGSGDTGSGDSGGGEPPAPTPTPDPTPVPDPAPGGDSSGGEG